jgi:hypothetical protein
MAEQEKPQPKLPRFPKVGDVVYIKAIVEDTFNMHADAHEDSRELRARGIESKHQFLVGLRDVTNIQTPVVEEAKAGGKK